MLSSSLIDWGESEKDGESGGEEKGATFEKSSKTGVSHVRCLARRDPL